LECGGKRSATPLLVCEEDPRRSRCGSRRFWFAKKIQGGVALRLPPHSKGLTSSGVLSFPGGELVSNNQRLEICTGLGVGHWPTG